MNKMKRFFSEKLPFGKVNRLKRIVDKFYFSVKYQLLNKKEIEKYREHITTMASLLGAEDVITDYVQNELPTKADAYASVTSHLSDETLEGFDFGKIKSKVQDSKDKVKNFVKKLHPNARLDYHGYLKKYFGVENENDKGYATLKYDSFAFNTKKNRRMFEKGTEVMFPSVKINEKGHIIGYPLDIGRDEKFKFKIEDFGIPEFRNKTLSDGFGLADSSLNVRAIELHKSAKGKHKEYFNTIAELLGITLASTNDKPKQAQEPITDNENLRTGYKVPTFNFDQYFNHTVNYFKTKYADEKIAIWQAKLDKAQKELDDFIADKENYHADKNNKVNYGDKKDKLAKVVRSTKMHINVFQKVKGSGWNDIGYDEYKNEIMQLIKASYKQNGGVLPEDLKDARIKELAHKSLVENGSWEFYPTPKEVVELMIELADLQKGMKILEPSGGKGDILDQIEDAVGSTAQVDTIELNPINREILKLKGYEVIAYDFLQTTPVGTGHYDRILMNPPFENMSDIEHIRHAINFLKPNGKIIAVCVQSRLSTKDQYAIEFKNLIKNYGSLHIIPPETMEEAERRAKVKIAVVTFDNAKYQEYLNSQKPQIETKDLVIGDFLINATNNTVYRVTDIEPLSLLEVGNDKAKPKIMAGLEKLPPNYDKITKEQADALERSNEGERNVSEFRNNDGNRSAGNNSERRLTIRTNTDTDAGFRRPELLDARPKLSQKPKTRGLDESISQSLMPHQQDGVNLALESLHKHGSFILADGTGSGKTFQQLATAYQFIKDNPKKSVLIVSISDDVLKQAFEGDARKMEQKTGLKIANKLQKLYFKSQEEFITNGKIYLAKYADFVQWGKNEKEYIEYETAKTNVQAANKKYTQMREEADADFEAGNITKLEHKQLKLSISNAEDNDPVYSKLIRAEDAWLAKQQKMFGRYGDMLSLVIFDECHKLKNWTTYDFSKGDTARRALLLAERADTIMFASATPADRADAMYYLKYAGLYQSENQFKQLLMQLGFVFHEAVRNDKGEVTRRERWTLPTGYDRQIAARGIEKAFEDLTEDGKMLKRELEMNNLEVKIEPTDCGEIAKRVNQIILQSVKKGGFSAKVYNEQMDATEPFKITKAVEVAKRELAEGRSVVIFARLVEEGETIKSHGDVKAGTIRELQKALAKIYGEDQIGLLIGAKTPADKKKRIQDVKDFQLGKKRIMIGTPATGATGISLDDSDVYQTDDNGEYVLNKQGEKILIKKGGTMPRTLICLTAPMNAELNVQMLGRINRAETKSRSRACYLFDFEINIEEWLADIVKKKMIVLNAVVAGQTNKMSFDNVEINVQDSEEDAAWQLLENDEKEEEKKTGKPKPVKKHRFFQMTKLNAETTGLNTNYKIWYETAKDYWGKDQGIVYFANTPKAETTKALYEQHKEWFDKHNFEFESGRYTGLVLKGTNTRGNKSDREKKHVEIWNYFCNLILPENSEVLTKTSNVFKQGDRVRSIQTIMYLGLAVPEGTLGTIQDVREREIANVKGESIKHFQYKVQFDNGVTINRVEPQDISTTEKYQYTLKDVWGMFEDDIYTNFVGKPKSSYEYSNPLREWNDTLIIAYNFSLISGRTEEINVADINLIENTIEFRDFSDSYIRSSSRITDEMMEKAKKYAKSIYNYLNEELCNLNDCQTPIMVADNFNINQYHSFDKNSVNSGGLNDNFNVARSQNGSKPNVPTATEPLNFVNTVSAQNNAVSAQKSPNEYRNPENVEPERADTMQKSTNDSPKRDSLNADGTPMNSKEILNITPTLYQLSGKNQVLLGALAKPFRLLMWGNPGSGKSTYALILSDDLAQFGNVIYFTAEEKVSTGRISQRMKNAGLTHTDKFFFDDSGDFDSFVKHLNTAKYRFAVIDSMNMLRNTSNEEILQLMREFPEVSFIIIAHGSKDGKIYKGATEVQFDVDTVVKVSNGYAETTKHRDGEANKRIYIFDNFGQTKQEKGVKFRLNDVFFD